MVELDDLTLPLASFASFFDAGEARGQTPREHVGFMRKPLPTDPSRCKAYGPGLRAAITRELSTFTIEAIDESGRRQEKQGFDDPFAVHVRTLRGGTATPCRLISHGNGTYTGGFKPIQSGTYTVSISLRGVPIQGSPWSCVVSTPTPSAPHCVLSGKALHEATARVQQAFDVSFRDSPGQIAHALLRAATTDNKPLRPPTSPRHENVS